VVRAAKLFTDGKPKPIAMKQRVAK